MTDEDEPALKRQRLEINCQDPSIKVKILMYVFVCILCGAAITNYHNAGWSGERLKQQKFTLSRSWRPEV